MHFFTRLKNAKNPVFITFQSFANFHPVSRWELFISLQHSTSSRNAPPTNRPVEQANEHRRGANTNALDKKRSTSFRHPL